jgi:type IV secretory pathway TraG/TraD family ATPase VirD4
LNDIDNLIATARSNKIATCLGVQDFSQLKKDYGANQAAVIMNIAGNIISGQVMGETAKQLSERFGKIVQVKESISINRNDTSISKSGQLDYAIPPSKISTLSSGEFVGMVSDDPNQKIDLKIFHCRIINDMEKLKSEETSQKKIPVHKPVSQQEISDNYYQIRMEAKRIVNELISPD